MAKEQETSIRHFIISCEFRPGLLGNSNVLQRIFRNIKIDLQFYDSDVSYDTANGRMEGPQQRRQPRQVRLGEGVGLSRESQPRPRLRACPPFFLDRKIILCVVFFGLFKSTQAAWCQLMFSDVYNLADAWKHKLSRVGSPDEEIMRESRPTTP